MNEKIRNWFTSHANDFIKLGILLICTGVAIWIFNNNSKQNELPYTLWITQHKADTEFYNAKADLANEVDSFIKVIAPESSLNGLAVVEACDEYGIDIRFVLAQGWKESHFGTCGIAAKNNGVFNKGAADGMTAEEVMKTNYYKHPDLSIRPYLKLLRNDYIPVGGSEFDLYKKFVNKSGKRYASDPNYENCLVAMYDSINSRTTIYQRMQHYHKCKIAAGR